MSAVSDRNIAIKRILDTLYARAIDNNLPIDESEYQESLDMLFSTTAWGFREILLVVVVGMNLDSSFRASTGLYDCNPRAIYEGPIKDFLIEKEIPHRKSGPLNIAKATVGLDTTWAAQRRPAKVAFEVVNLIQYMENTEGNSINKINNIGVSLLRRLISESKRIEALTVEIEPSADPEFLYYLCYELITKVPDAGNTPQKIIAFLLKNYHKSMDTGIIVTGEEDRASVTSTTSKKPGDVNEESSCGIIYKVYEVTVKPFDLARIRDSYDSILKYNRANNTSLDEIMVICRKEDCPIDIKNSGLHSFIGSYGYQNITYYYLDIYEWISDRLYHMTQEGRIAFYNDLNSYISDINTAETVKVLWSNLHQ
ncbi:hypothetical protein [Listeria monocytogenes]|uniref:hypothetical protein n=1 Tax=Listeria monocytogenes TaxID=1639 RepID=UPI001243ED3F|nr:hypothetical protein [Listeria monocytogenes]KAA9590166.1 hypothetical protein DCK12_13685 [Listeria monocytogenes]KAA9592769.1 hypothetical protein DCK13_14390 [Listeria monocytogenes]MCM8893892.1 hypothetical protein [Listeria monocytogenes]MTI95780.1 hypothetical protein [Bacillota bacterium]